MWQQVVEQYMGQDHNTCLSSKMVSGVEYCVNEVPLLHDPTEQISFVEEGHEKWLKALKR